MSERIFLIGYRGTGKSTIARLVAERLGWFWCDADEVLERRFGNSIREIFQDEGEPGFRDKESIILEELRTRTRHVIATGGGVVLRPDNRSKLKSGTTIWLQAPPAVIWDRLQADTTSADRRPNLAQGGLAEIAQLLSVREPLYLECADATFVTVGAAPELVADEVVLWLQARGIVDILKA